MSNARTSERITEWTNEWMNEWMNEWTEEKTKERKIEGTSEKTQWTKAKIWKLDLVGMMEDNCKNCTLKAS